METTELIAMIREGAKGCDPGDTMVFPETGKIICVADLLEVADRLECLDELVNEWEPVVHGYTPVLMDGDLIPRAAVLKFPIRRDHCDMENGNPHFINGIETVMEYVEYIPAAEAEPVVHAHWVPVECGTLCSACMRVFDSHFEIRRSVCLEMKRCPDCGAHMDEEVTHVSQNL